MSYKLVKEKFRELTKEVEDTYLKPYIWFEDNDVQRAVVGPEPVWITICKKDIRYFRKTTKLTLTIVVSSDNRKTYETEFVFDNEVEREFLNKEARKWAKEFDKKLRSC